MLSSCAGIRFRYHGNFIEAAMYKITELLYFVLNAGICYLCHVIAQVRRGTARCVGCRV